MLLLLYLIVFLLFVIVIGNIIFTFYKLNELEEEKKQISDFMTKSSGILQSHDKILKNIDSLETEFQTLHEEILQYHQQLDGIKTDLGECEKRSKQLLTQFSGSVSTILADIKELSNDDKKALAFQQAIEKRKQLFADYVNENTRNVEIHKTEIEQMIQDSNDKVNVLQKQVELLCDLILEFQKR